MTRFVLALTIAGALIGPPAHAQSAETEDNRYQFNRVEDGYLRLDLKSGQVSLCSRHAAGWACQAVPDDRAAYDGEIARLQNENAALKKAMLDRSVPLPGAATSEAPGAPPDRDVRPPNHVDVDRMLSAVEKVWRRLVEMLMSLQEKKT